MNIIETITETARTAAGKAYALIPGGSRDLRISGRLATYVDETWTHEPAAAAGLSTATAALSERGMKIGADQGRILHWLARSISARRTVEVGVFTGYSALWTALALPDDGTLVACDVSEEWTSVARPYWEEAGVADRIDLRIAPALDTLDSLLADGGADEFDMAFIDADKSGYDAYYERCLQLVRPGGLIAIDNVLWGGAVADPSRNDEDTVAIRALNAKVTSDDRVDACLLPVGDGLTLARRR
ncbi:MAG: class I SAM-dependent methyltransferase [Actinomycetota bacterium]